MDTNNTNFAPHGHKALKSLRLAPLAGRGLRSIRARSEFLARHELIVLRFWNHQVCEELDNVAGGLVRSPRALLNKTRTLILSVRQRERRTSHQCQAREKILAMLSGWRWPSTATGRFGRLLELCCKLRRTAINAGTVTLLDNRFRNSVRE
jgi:hypothetical protein